MNSGLYKLVFNAKRGMMVAVGEDVAFDGAGGGSRTRATATRTVHVGLPRPHALPLFLAAVFGGFASMPQLVWAVQGGQVVQGAATIQSQGAKTQINQTSQNAVIQWQNFNIGAGQSVKFVQPNASSAVLNRVMSNEPSTIAGQLSANGRVFIVNPNGVIFSQGAQIDVGALIASTLNIGNADFMAGRYQFKADGQVLQGTVVNQGNIKAVQAALLGAEVRNSGTIEANTALAAGESITLQLGTSDLQVAVDAAGLRALVDNQGLIRAPGGQIILTAAGRDSLLRAAVTNTGTLDANSVSTEGGRIVLKAVGGGMCAWAAASAPTVQGPKAAAFRSRAKRCASRAMHSSAPVVP